ncbi:MAG: phosphogluconate dehydratase [Methylibium sp.]|uniref:phosphogluconate dehydratase n=1 Tax=Methylibium sp. TaxID=2067992 RepID=UPI0017A6696F|nr:phosphogluconate dehydratase [Methylibium sp.]MBA3597260.1 phosphogluconate dehydratase [Methylibium sp.]
MAIHPEVARVTVRVQERSRAGRLAYLARMAAARDEGPSRGRVSCTNLAHAMAASPTDDKLSIREQRAPNIAIVSSYNDMLSAHQPLATFPDIIKRAAREAGATAQFAGGVPAMCDGVTQGQPGMELSLWSRDIIAQGTAIALSHAVFDGALMLGICDKIVPGLLIGALAFGHLPVIFVPGGPMTSGLPNSDKAKVRQLFAQGKADRTQLLQAEMASYHGPGTCTFYGTANSNQMLMEVMGLHLPGAAFVNPGTKLRDALTAEAARRVVALTALGREYTPIGEIVDERAIVNAIVGLLATGGSTNHTLHLVAIARMAGITIDWTDFDELSAVTPLLTRMYPNGQADVNHFHAAGGMGLLIRELLDAGLLHEDVRTVAGEGLRAYANEPWLGDADGEADGNEKGNGRVNGGARVAWRPAPAASGDTGVLRTAADPFDAHAGVRLLRGNLGRAIFKASAVKPEHRVVTAPVRVFDGQMQMLAAFKAGELARDVIVVVRFQGPRANGMPELHMLTPSLAVLQDQGHKVALVTDGRMSGASGKVPAAIHVSPEAVAGGLLGKLRDGDVVRLDGEAGVLEALVDAAEWARREPALAVSGISGHGYGRELFASHRRSAAVAEEGAVSWA